MSQLKFGLPKREWTLTKKKKIRKKKKEMPPKKAHLYIITSMFIRGLARLSEFILNRCFRAIFVGESTDIFRRLFFYLFYFFDAIHGSNRSTEETLNFSCTGAGDWEKPWLVCNTSHAPHKWRISFFKFPCVHFPSFVFVCFGKTHFF